MNPLVFLCLVGASVAIPAPQTGESNIFLPIPFPPFFPFWPPIFGVGGSIGGFIGVRGNNVVQPEYFPNQTPVTVNTPATTFSLPYGHYPVIVGNEAIPVPSQTQRFSTFQSNVSPVAQPNAGYSAQSTVTPEVFNNNAAVYTQAKVPTPYQSFPYPVPYPVPIPPNPYPVVPPYYPRPPYNYNTKVRPNVINYTQSSDVSANSGGPAVDGRHIVIVATPVSPRYPGYPNGYPVNPVNQPYTPAYPNQGSDVIQV